MRRTLLTRPVSRSIPACGWRYQFFPDNRRFGHLALAGVLSYASPKWETCSPCTGHLLTTIDKFPRGGLVGCGLSFRAIPAPMPACLAIRHGHLKIPRCGLQSSNCYIDSDGSVYPCLPLWGKNGKRGPNAYEIGLKKAWSAYDRLDCYQCASVFTIEKGFFYTFNLPMLFEYLTGFEFLRNNSKSKSHVAIKRNSKPRRAMPQKLKVQSETEQAKSNHISLEKLPKSLAPGDRRNCACGCSIFKINLLQLGLR